ncbi:hypothetical protein PT974_04957 [Cladobotryum mycophilum]|uniref:Heterokaryon incompatibility domain-containing protein n=1 Tax=Cladobotryum mycophilum TaxID=491253 RepID=A0ABR0SQN3_9HYPO
MSLNISSVIVAKALELSANEVAPEKRIQFIWANMWLELRSLISAKQNHDREGECDSDDLEECTVESVASEGAKPTTCAEDASNHFELLETSLYDLLDCDVSSRNAMESTLVPITAANILHRLPKSSTRLVDNMCSVYDNEDPSFEGYLLTNSSTALREHGFRPRWEDYKVTIQFDTNMIRLIFQLAIKVSRFSHYAARITKYWTILPPAFTPGRTSLSLDGMATLSPALFVLRLRTRLRHELNAYWIQSLPSPDMDVDPVIDFSALGSSLQSDDQVGLGCDYVCRYSFDLLRSSALSGTRDYRTFFACFNEQFADSKPRCRQISDGSWEQCNGRSWASCGRFFGVETPDHSAHDIACTKICRRLPWSEESYRSVQGPRSVAYSLTPRGGKADEGFNECLHSRYSDIARDLGCDSYWIDAACIPSDRELRSAAIKTINPIFRNSKATLICDKDIMEVDVGEPLSVPRLEVLMSVLLLSDWNVRGWTMLEVIRGNKAVYLLCKGNRLIALKDILATLYRGGRVDLCAS